MSAFKAYDIRGIYNKDFDKDTAYRIGFFLKDLFGAKSIAVGRDCRLSSDEIFEYLTKGITDSGCDVVDLGLTTTPMTYFAAFEKGFETAVMITASHNPKNYNGFKISGPNAVPVGKESGLADLEKWVNEKDVSVSVNKGKITSLDIKNEYIKFMKEKIADISSLNFAVDCSNGSSAVISKEIFGDKAIYLNDVPDGNFPGHSPNPMMESARKDLKACVKENALDIGIIFDGDADRVMFLDNKGKYISPDLILCVLANALIEEEGECVVMDIRSSKAVYYYVKELLAEPIIWKVGHAYAKAKIRETGALFGGELAGHYYFKDFGCCDSGVLAAIYVLNTLAEFKEDGYEIADIIKEFSVFASSGELNFKTDNKDEIIKKVTRHYKKKDYIKFYDFDGIRYEFDEWWFNMRKSNTEPYLRLVVEAKDKKMLEEKIEELKKFII
ncbi:MAG: phosphomannomutase/phosphoglucomutase [Clostridia bacterium]|nr:phosphomannomutase/phosphoglucomutase [Clostridia bacterium]